jgi:hypothetical protein
VLIIRVVGVQCSSLTVPVVKHILVIDIGVDYEGSGGTM